MEALWCAWSDARSEKSAHNVATRLLRQLDRPVDQLTFAPYPKTGGWEFSFRTQVPGARWNDYVVHVIALGQRVAYNWALSGDILQDPTGWSTKPRTSGVTAIQWQLWTPEQANMKGN